ncbi:hypothetical protein H4R26_001233 [Coemansia thaxteri]|uniref:Uncharacterized protein n=1 Tax=Coemansia thaxteri TaxID=2663907 RepID=A0A9W8BH66_9FUNG|nr:hypothetical protein H4R26_001233 [Coemansia thaxteri]
MVAEHWRAESDSVKDHFKQQYKDEMIKYEVSKKLLRYNASSSTSSLSSSSSSRPVSRHSSEMPVATEHLPAYSSYNSPSLPVDYDAGTACQNQRSPFLPAVADKPQHDISRLIH